MAVFGIVDPSVQQQASSKFGIAYDNGKRANRTLVTDHTIRVSVKATDSTARSTNRGMLSHLSATRDGLRNVCANSRYLIHTLIQDDATMWTKRALTPAEKRAIQEKKNTES